MAGRNDGRRIARGIATRGSATHGSATPGPATPGSTTTHGSAAHGSAPAAPPVGQVDTSLIGAIEAIYETAATPSSWPYALEKIAGVFGDVGAVLIYHRDDGSFGTIVSPSLEAAQRQYEQGGWHRRDTRAIRALERGLVVGDAFTDRHLLSAEEIEQDPFYNEFLIPHGLGWLAPVGISPDPRVVAWISVQRTIKKPAFSDEELKVLTRIGQHAENALRLGIRLLDSEMIKLSLGEALARVQVGVFVLDREQRIIFSNPEADRLIGGDLKVTDGRLTAQFNPVRDALETALSDLSSPLRDGASATRPILIEGSEPASTLAVYILPVCTPYDPAVTQFLANAHSIILLISANTDQAPDPGLVRDLLGLTLGEARLASLIASGHRPAAAAERLGVAEATARSVLKRVFSKAGVSSQSELATLLTRLVIR